MSTVVNSALTNPLSGSLLPSTDNVFNLGATSFRYKNVYATNGTIQTSDISTKRNIKESDLGLQFVLQLEPKSFYWNDGDRKHYGFIAQDIQKLTQGEFGGWVDGSTQGLRYTEFISPIVQAIKELNEKVENMGVVTKDIEIVVEKPVYRVVEVETIVEKPVVTVHNVPESVERPVFNIHESVSVVDKPVIVWNETQIEKPVYKVVEVESEVSKSVNKLQSNWVHYALLAGLILDIIVRLAR
jgi:hypothetical protein